MLLRENDPKNMKEPPNLKVLITAKMKVHIKNPHVYIKHMSAQKMVRFSILKLIFKALHSV